MNDSNVWDAARVAAASGVPGLRVELVEAVGSTSAELLGRPMDPMDPLAPLGDALTPPVLLAAARQTAGRGRRGRSWTSDPTASLTFSVALERRIGPGTPPPPALPLALGAAIAEALDGLGARCRLKWPNDLQMDGRKAGGLLVEARRVGALERTVVGLGLNLLPDARIEAAAGQPVVALFAGIASMPDRSLLLGRVAGAMVRAFERCAAEGFEPFRAAWAARDALAGRPVRVSEGQSGGQEDWSGVACGIDETGRLLVWTAQGVRAVLAADVSVRAAE